MKILAIDPGINTGVAVYENGILVKLCTIQPIDLQDALRVAEYVVLEDSRLQSHVWVKASGAALAKVSRNIGMIDAYCAMIVAWCGRFGIPCLSVSPKDKGAKLKAEQFAHITGYEAKSNQHERDAAMIGWPHRSKKIETLN
jgi:hypothetical protein